MIPMMAKKYAFIRCISKQSNLYNTSVSQNIFSAKGISDSFILIIQIYGQLEFFRVLHDGLRSEITLFMKCTLQ